MLAATTLVAFTGCIDTTKLGVKTTSKVMAKAQPAMKAESDYELAARAIPASLKTVEGFHVAYPDITRLTKILAEGYCQYGSGFVEDEWEVADMEKRFEDRKYIAGRATKMYIRCMNYGLELMGKGFTTKFFAPLEEFEKELKKVGPGKRDHLLWVAFGLASAINMNKDRPEMLTHLPRAKALFNHIMYLDEKHNIHANDPAKRLLPHVALGSMNTAVSDAVLGAGTNDQGGESFKKAMEISRVKQKDGSLGPVRFLLAKVYYARKYAVIKQDRQMFHKLLVEVLQTDPAIWPEQRLANEIAHRRARRYLMQEKELF